MYLLKDALTWRAGKLLEVEIDNIEKYLMDLAMEKGPKRSRRRCESIFFKVLLYGTGTLQKMLHDLNILKKFQERLLERLGKIEDATGLFLDEIQRKAVMEAAKQGILVLTGGPGTGKTTTINAMIRLFESEGMTILLAAPTGRAAKRMTETTGYEASTIHRLLEVSGNPEEETIELSEE